MTLAHLPCIGWVQVGGALTLCVCSTFSFRPSFHFYCLCVCLILLYVLIEVYLLWHEWCVGFWALVPCLSSFLWTGRCLGEGPHLPDELMFFFFVFVGLLATNPVTSLHHVCCSYTLPFTSCYPVNSWTNVPIHFFVNPLLRASQAHFLHLYLFLILLANIPAVPAHFIISFLGLSQLIYSLFTSFTPMGFC